MSKNDLKLWSCNLRNSKDDNNTETYENATINTDDWTCTENMENIENIENFENTESDASIQKTVLNKINHLKTSIFGDSEYSDYYFYGSLFLIIMLIVYLTSKYN